MICEACQKGNHDACTEGDCHCEERVKDLIEKEALRYQNMASAGIAETIYSNLLYGGSPVTRLLTDGAGKDNVKLFIKAVLFAHRAVQN